MADTLTGRTWLYRAPESRVPPFPLLIALHHSGMGILPANGRAFEYLTGLTDLCNKAGIAVLYPDGQNGTWHTQASDPSDDTLFIARLLEVYADWIDPINIFVVGYSAGGCMAERLVCELPGTCAALMDVSGTLEAGIALPPIAPHFTLHIHGTADGFIPFGGPDKPPAWGRFTAQEVVRSTWERLGAESVLEPVIGGSHFLWSPGLSARVLRLCTRILQDRGSPPTPGVA